LYSKLFIKVKSHLSVLSNLSRPNLSVYDGHEDWQANSDLCFLDRSKSPVKSQPSVWVMVKETRQKQSVNSHLLWEGISRLASLLLGLLDDGLCVLLEDSPTLIFRWE
jgi:hypothetical protein